MSDGNTLPTVIEPPAPLIAPEVDLRKFPFMPMHISLLLESPAFSASWLSQLERKGPFERFS